MILSKEACLEENDRTLQNANMNLNKLFLDSVHFRLRMVHGIRLNCPLEAGSQAKPAFSSARTKGPMPQFSFVYESPSETCDILHCWIYVGLVKCQSFWQWCVVTDIHTLVLLPGVVWFAFQLLQVQGVLKLIDSVPVLSPKDFGSLKVGCRENTAGSNTQDVYVVCFGTQHSAKPTGSPP